MNDGSAGNGLVSGGNTRAPPRKFTWESIRVTVGPKPCTGSVVVTPLSCDGTLSSKLLKNAWTEPVAVFSVSFKLSIAHDSSVPPCQPAPEAKKRIASVSAVCVIPWKAGSFPRS